VSDCGSVCGSVGRTVGLCTGWISSFVRSFVPSFVCVVRSFVSFVVIIRSFVRLMFVAFFRGCRPSVRPSVRPFVAVVRSFGHSVIRSFVRSFVRLLLCRLSSAIVCLLFARSLVVRLMDRCVSFFSLSCCLCGGGVIATGGSKLVVLTSGHVFYLVSWLVHDLDLRICA